MKSRLVSLALLLSLLPFILACGNGNHDFLDCSVTVAPWRVDQGFWREYHLVFKFNKPGVYDISFSRPDGYEDYNDRSFVPKSFRQIVIDPGRESEFSVGGVHITKKVVVHIKKSGVSQSHEFNLCSFSMNNMNNAPGW